MSETATILICRLSALGDIVLSLPTVEALRARFPKARLEFLARDPYHRVLTDVKTLDAVHAWAGKGHPAPPAVADRKWDVVVDLSGSGRSRRLLGAISAGRRLRVRKHSARRMAFVHLRWLGASGSGIVPAVERMLATVAPLDPPHVEPYPRFDVPRPPNDGPVLIAPGAGRDTKRWPAERFRDIARRVATEEGRSVRVIGTENEAKLLRDIASGAGDLGAAIACDDLARLPTLVAECSAAITNDSGLLHVAEACGLPVVALFGPTHPALGFAPRGERSQALHLDLTCSPCDLHGPVRCPLKHHRCLADLSTDRVFEAVQNVLRAGAGV